MGNRGVTLYNLGVSGSGFAVTSLGPLKGGGAPPPSKLRPSQQLSLTL